MTYTEEHSSQNYKNINRKVGYTPEHPTHTRKGESFSHSAQQSPLVQDSKGNVFPRQLPPPPFSGVSFI